MSSAAPTVLLVDDDPNDRLLLQILFERAGEEVTLRELADGREAVDYLSGRGAYADRSGHPLPCLLLLDLKLPRMSGFEVLAWVRKERGLSDLPIIVLSSSQEQRDLIQAYELGASSYLVKTVDLAAMREIVRGIVELARLTSARSRASAP